MKITKITKITKVLAILSFIGFAGSSFAQVVTVNNLYINSINVGVKESEIDGIRPITDGSYITIKPSREPLCTTITCAASFPVCESKHIVLFPNHSYFGEIYSMLLSAQLSEKKLSISMTEVSSGTKIDHCILESVESIN